MKKSILIVYILFISITAFSQSMDNFPCKRLKKTKKTRIYTSGLIDHTDMEIEWIKKEVNRDSLNTWTETYIKKAWFSGIEINDRNRKHFRQEVEYLISRLEKIEEFVEESDKFYYYSTPDSYWSALAGQDGIIILRECKVMGVIIITQS